MKHRPSKESRYSNLPGQKNLRRHLRRVPTRAERKLWNLLRNRQLSGKRFRRQHGIGPYVVDFFCAEEKLTVEIDGEVHDHPNHIEHDRERDRYLEGLDIRIIRLRNEMFFDDPDSVVELIASYFTPTVEPEAK